MRYFFDTEFIEDGKTIDLISIGIVAEDGREYYAISTEFDEDKASPWVKDNVLTHLPTNWIKKNVFIQVPYGDDDAWRSRQQIKQEILEFAPPDSKPEFWAYYADYDWVAFCQLFGTMMDLPSGYPMYCRDLKQLMDERSLSCPAQSSDEHHALNDARWVRDAVLHYLEVGQ